MLRIPIASEVIEYLVDIGKIGLYRTGKKNILKKAQNLCVIIMVYHKLKKTSKRYEKGQCVAEIFELL